MRKLNIVWITVLFSSVIHAQNIKEDHQELKQVIEDFRISIIKHDNEEQFMNLFLHDSITWSYIMVGKTKEALLKQRPDFTFLTGDARSFYRNLKGESEEKFYNIKIDVRDEFATISFDYTFNLGVNILNWGTEYWSLMLVNDSWKITSVTWSGNIQNIENCPFESDDFFTLE